MVMLTIFAFLFCCRLSIELLKITLKMFMILIGGLFLFVGYSFKLVCDIIN